MSNVYAHTQWKLDTAGTITSEQVRIRRMEFVPNAANDDVLVQDNNSEDIWRVTNALAGGRAGVETIDFGPRGYNAVGFVLTISASCLLHVWLA